MMLSEIVAPGAVITGLASQQRDDVVAELIDALAAAGAVPRGLRDVMVASVLERERRGSTGFGKGVAVPHVKHADARAVRLAIGLSQAGVDFNALDKQPVYSVFLLVSPADRPEDHLKAMEVIFKHLSVDTFRRFLRQAATPDAVIDLLREADAQQSAG